MITIETTAAFMAARMIGTTASVKRISARLTSADTSRERTTASAMLAMAIIVTADMATEAMARMAEIAAAIMAAARSSALMLMDTIGAIARDLTAIIAAIEIDGTEITAIVRASLAYRCLINQISNEKGGQF